MPAFYVFCALISLAPLYFAGNHPVPLMLLEYLALVLVFFWFKQQGYQTLNSQYRWFVLVLCLLPLLQLSPLPLAIWQLLPGYEAYAQGMSSLGASLSHSFRTLSVVPSATHYSGLALLPPVVVFLYTLTLPREKVSVVVHLFVGVVVVEALLGLMQYGGGVESMLRLPNAPMSADAVGTYANRDHLAGLLEMALPLCIGLIFATIVQKGSVRRHARTIQQKLALMAASHFHKAFLYALVAIVVLLGLIFTRSRTGNFLAMLAIFLSAIAFSARLGGKNAYGLMGILSAVAAFLALEIGMVPVINRFILEDPLADARWLIFQDTIAAAAQFFPLGSGAGTFVHVFPRFQTTAFSGVFVNHAHNDYLEWLLEGGLVALLLIAGYILFYIKNWFLVWRRGPWRTLNFIQVGAGIGIFCMMLHGFVDFNLHIPANQIYFAFLSGLFFYSRQEIEYEEMVEIEAQISQDVTSELVLKQSELPRKSFVDRKSNPFSES